MLLRTLAAAAFIVAAAAPSSAAARTRHHGPVRSGNRIHRGHRSHAIGSGWATILGASAGNVQLSGQALDQNLLPVDGTRSNPLKLALPSAGVYASAQLCSQRSSSCSTSSYSGWQWIPVTPSFARNGDKVAVILAVRKRAALADYRAHKAIPVSWMYDVS